MAKSALLPHFVAVAVEGVDLQKGARLDLKICAVSAGNAVAPDRSSLVARSSVLTAIELG